MSSVTSIRVLEHDSNRRGDLFARLMAELLVALGYEQPRLNIHKSGREIDLDAAHRLEARRALAECKATSDPVGGSAINKFVGAFDIESKRDKRAATCYFISLSGFTESAIEQEKERNRDDVLLLTGAQVVEELVKGRSLIARDRATELAGRLTGGHSRLVLDVDAELLAHERGFIWAVYYTQGLQRTHFALIHADGTPLARAVAEDVIAADEACGGPLHEMVCLNPQPKSDPQDETQAAMAAYRTYIDQECGAILLDGLPANGVVGARPFNLENLFVPLHLDVATGRERRKQRQPVGTVLAGHPRLALLAAPGGGKSTLIKRLALAYAHPKRRALVADELPDRDWLPVFIRCRELRELARAPFVDLLTALARREPVRQHADAFMRCVDRAFLDGRVLLLVDGLDEISDLGDRAAFVSTLRTALLAYPGTPFVVTSREAGFRHVAAHLDSICTHAMISPFDADDIQRLCVAWHREVVGKSEKVETEAKQLAATIVSNDRIRQLGVNPLLLTTLLLVKRWVGRLPTRRAVLYGKAVEVLLMTWNTEGHDPIPDEEALPQLGYIASSMMMDGVQKLSRWRLATLLQEARNALPIELGHVRGSVEGFVHRVEDRSSLLMMTGLDVEDGQLVEFFEFRHSAFQEFLTARAAVEGWHPGRREKDTLVTVLEPYFMDEEWREVIPLAAVLGGQQTEPLVKRLTERVRELPGEGSMIDVNPLFLALANCLADEAAARPETIRAAVRELTRLGTAMSLAPLTKMLARGRYGKDLRTEAGREYLQATNPSSAGYALSEMVWWQTLENEGHEACARAASQFVEMMSAPDLLARCEGCVGVQKLCQSLDEKQAARDFTDELSRAGSALLKILSSEEPAEQDAVVWALGRLGPCRVWVPPPESDVLGQLYKLWREGGTQEVRRMAPWALASLPLGPRHKVAACTSIRPQEFELLVDDAEFNETEQAAALVVAWYLGTPWSDAEIASRAGTLLKEESQIDASTTARTLRDLMVEFGEEP